MKVSILGGAGAVGSATAFRIVHDESASEVVLIDRKRNFAEAHALDLDQAAVHRSATRVRCGDLEEAAGSDVIIVSASVPHRTSVSSRSEFLKENLPLTFELVGGMAPVSPSALWIVATIPVDPLVYLIHKRFSIPRNKVMGLNRNDTSRLRWAIAASLDVPAFSVTAYVLGEHGETKVPVFSHVVVDGEKVVLTPEQIEDIRTKISGFFVSWNRLQPDRTAAWTSAESMADLVLNIAGIEDNLNCCSTPLEGEYGLHDVSLGVPVKLGKEGVREIVELTLNEREQRGLEASAAAVKDVIAQGDPHEL